MKRSLFGLALQANRSNRHQPSLETLMGEHSNKNSTEAVDTKSLNQQKEMQNADVVVTGVKYFFGKKFVNPQTGQDANMFVSTSSGNSYIKTYGGDDVVYLNADHEGEGLWSGFNEFNTNTLTGGGDDKVYGSVMNDWVVLGEGDDWAIGNKGDDRLFGCWGNDFLDGGEDDDILIGGEGIDVLTGGSGKNDLYGGMHADNFIVGLTGNAQDRDRIMDFEIGDKLTLTHNGQLAQWGDWVVEQFMNGVAIVDTENMDQAAFIAGVSLDDLLFTNGHTVEMQLA